MFHKRLFKVLINLALLLILFTSQVAASGNSVDTNSKDSFLPEASQLNEVQALQTSDPAQEPEDDLLSASKTIRISGENGGDNPSISMDGRYIAYESSGNIVLYDLGLLTNTVIDSGSDPFISATGRYVAFVQGNGVYVWDTVEETKRMIGGGSQPSISADGRFVVFTSNDDVLIRDTLYGITRRVSVLPDPEDEEYNSFFDGYISADGKRVAFSSSGVYPYPYFTWPGVYVRNLETHTTIQVASDTTGKPTLSVDGRYIAYLLGDVEPSAPTCPQPRIVDLQDNTVHFTEALCRFTQEAYVSGDGRYMIDSSVFGGKVYVHDLEKNMHHEISLAPDGTNGNGFSSDGILSADGQVVAFTSSSTNLIDGEADTNGKTDIFVRSLLPKPPLILVHGWQGAPGSTTSYSCDQSIHRYDPQGGPDYESTLQGKVAGDSSLADWFVEAGYDVWIAHLSSTPTHTSSLYFNAECLQKQIEIVNDQNSLPITIVAHSMGGLVSRAAVKSLTPGMVKHIYTMGTPHAGVFPNVLIYAGCKEPSPSDPPYEWIDLLGGFINSAACQMTPEMMPMFNARNKNLNDIGYNFISGDAHNSPDPFGVTLNYIYNFQGGDGAVSRTSGVGWINTDGEFDPEYWPGGSEPGQYWVDAVHANVFGDSYYSATSGHPGEENDTFKCILSLENHDPLSGCVPAETGPEIIEDIISDITGMQFGHLDSTQSVSIPFDIDTNSKSSFQLIYKGSKPVFFVTSPSGQVFDSSYVAINPTNVTYTDFPGGIGSFPFLAYDFGVTEIGQWQLNISAANSVDYLVYMDVESERVLSADTDTDLYQVGDTISVIATLNKSAVALTGATVNASMARPDGVTDVISLSDPENDGVYMSTYVVPDVSGYIPIMVEVEGDDNGIIYTRIENLVVAVMADDLHLTNSFIDAPNDGNADGFYEYLDFNIGVNADIASEYEFSAELYAGSELVAHAADYFDLATGSQTVTLRFDGSAIREMGLDGPYTIKNLYATSLDNGIPALNVADVFTTSVYNYTEFGRFACYALAVDHTGQGSNPEVSPSRSDGCFTNEFVPGEFIELTDASPAAGYQIDSWSGSIADANTSNSNTALMPANPHTVTVHYVDPTAPIATFLGGNGSDKTYSMAEDAIGNIYVSGSSSESWGTPLQPFVGAYDGYVAKTDESNVILWATFLGGTGDDYIQGTVTDDMGNVYVTGYSAAGWGDPKRAYTGDWDAFVAKLDPSGTLLWNTFLGENGSDRSYDIVVDESQNVYVTGHSPSSWETPERPFTDINDGFVAKLGPSGDLVWNTFLGGNGTDTGYGIDLDDSGNVYVTGYSDSSWASPSSPYTAGTDTFVVKLDPSGDLLWNTFLGGSGNDLAYDVTVNSSGEVFVAGNGTQSWGNPVVAYTAGQDGMVARLNSSGALVWNTFFGGSGTDYGYNIKVDEDGNLNIAGGSSAGWGVPIQAYNANYDAIFVKLNPSGGLLANTFLGGSGLDKGYDFSLSDHGNVYLVGYSTTTWGNPLRAYTASEDGFLTRFNIDDASLIVSSVTRNGVSPTSSSSVNFTVTFSEPVTGVDASDFVLTTTGVTGASIGSVTGSGDIYTITVDTGSGDGTVRLDILDDDTILNSASSPLVAGFTSGPSYSIDKTPPTVQSSMRVSTSPTASTSVDFNVTFSEPVTGVDVSDFVLATSGVTGANIGNLTGTGDTYTVTVDTGSGNGTIRLDVLDDDTILDAVSRPLADGFASGQSYTIDITSPTVQSSVRVSANPSASATVDFIVTFSEPVTGVDTSDFSLTTNGLTDESIGSVTGTGDTYIVTVDTGSGDGTINLGVMDDDTILDAALNQLADEFTSGQSYTIDKTPPTVQSSVRVSTSPTTAASVNFTVTFSESVTGVDASDFVLTTTGVTGASIGSVTGSGDTYTVTVNTGSDSGTIRLNVVDDDSVLDAAMNPLGGSGSGNGNFNSGEVYTLDRTAPTVVSSLRAVTTPAAASKVTFTVNFSESVTGVNASDFSLTTSGSITGASVGTVTGSGSVYTVTVNAGSGSGTIRLNVVDDDSIVDVVANKFGGTGIGNGNYSAGQVFTIASLTVYSAAAEDGLVLESAENSNIGGSVFPGISYFSVGDDASNRQSRGILHFETSTLPDTAIITSLTLKVKQLGTVVGTNPFTTHGNLVVDIKKPNFGAAGALALDDFNAAPDQAASGTFSSTPIASWFSAVFNVNGFSSVNLTGSTQLRLAFALDDNNDAGADYISFSSGNDTANQPQFIIEYYVP